MVERHESDFEFYKTYWSRYHCRTQPRSAKEGRAARRPERGETFCKALLDCLVQKQTPIRVLCPSFTTLPNTRHRQSQTRVSQVLLERVINRFDSYDGQLAGNGGALEWPNRVRTMIMMRCDRQPTKPQCITADRVDQHEQGSTRN